MRNRTAIIVIVLSILSGFLGATFFSDKAKSRKPSSLGTPRPNPIGKHLALLKVEIANPTGIPDSGSDKEVQLNGRILINQQLQGDLSYSWTLPDGVKIVEGVQNDSLANVHSGQIIELKITVSGFNKEKQQYISLQASGKGGSEIMGGSAVITSRPEDTWEAVAPDMKKAAEEQLNPSKSR
ncbi:MAG: hypothetical protein ACXVCY_17850 [Pseudobdellovibrionaceae bacterium]